MMALGCVLIAYLLGSIPTAYYAVKWVKKMDLRTLGSGNLGYTNAARVLGYGGSIPILVFDVLKGIAAVQIARSMLPGQEGIAVLCGLAAIAGHNWTIFLGFQGGGKGVATSAGVFGVLMIVPLLIALIMFLLTVAITRYMSLGSMVGALSLVIAGLVLIFLDSPMAPSLEAFAFSIVAAGLVIVRHRTNMVRLLKGEELKLGVKENEESF